jgi:UDP-N-acetylglucosamine--N-acetylmuramyl-(pentapeptide) pyrophosphoryl-undecaprenol N-acetylglucosamine transferase
MNARQQHPLIAIACGGTGGHLYPGMAVADELLRRDCDALLLVSQKEVDLQAVRMLPESQWTALSAVGMQGGNWAQFTRGFLKSFRAARELFAKRRPKAVLGMGGFTSAPPVLAGKMAGAATFLHESNSIPGRANRLAAPLVNQVFVGFPSARMRLHNRNVVTTGTPVRPHFQPSNAESCRMALGLAPNRPVLLVLGGSQGATPINNLLVESLPLLRAAQPELQVLHLTGPNDLENVRSAYQNAGLSAVVQPFLTEMDMALGAATLCVSRAGASSLAELAAMRVPAILVPFPAAADNHQYYNARAYSDANAAWILDQAEARNGKLAQLILNLLHNENARTAMSNELSRWHAPHAAERIADQMLSFLKAKGTLFDADTEARSATPDGQLHSAIA